MKYTLKRMALFACLVAASNVSIGSAQEADSKLQAETDQVEVSLSEQAQQAEQEMRKMFEQGSEALAMLDAITQGKRMGPDDGWFELAKPQSKFDWDWVLEQYDLDGDQTIEEAEFAGSSSDFKALDRNHDRRWTQADWEWANTRGSNTFRRLADQIDADESGEVTAEELQEFVAQLHSAGGSLSIEQLRSKIEAPERFRKDSTGPTPSHLVMGLRNQEIGSHQPGPNVGEVAPDFEIKDLDGRLHSLSKTVQDKPTVLIFGNFTCGPFRSQAGNVRRLIQRYKDRVNFLMVYVREAHPADGWNMRRNEANGIEILQPRTFDARKQVAERCSLHFDAGVPMLVDSLDDPVGALYSGMPSRLYLIDQDQKIVFKSGRGPHYFLPSDLENSLVMFLSQEPLSNTGK